MLNILIRKFLSIGWNVGSVYKLLQKLYRLLGRSTIIPTAMADDTELAQLITLILLKKLVLHKQ